MKSEKETSPRGVDAPAPSDGRAAKKGGLREGAESILVAVLIAFVLRAFVVEAFKIPTGSMIPTLEIGDHIFVNKFVYGLRIPMTSRWFVEWGTPKRGEVIVFLYPEDTSKDYIKRVVAVAGDRIRVRGSELFIDGEALDHRDARELHISDEGDDESGSEPRRETMRVVAYRETSRGGAHAYDVIYEQGGRTPAFPDGRARPGLDCSAIGESGDAECIVEKGYVFTMGDNRDNSSDGRVWGAVPTSYVVGRAIFIWWSMGPDAGVRWRRLFSLVH